MPPALLAENEATSHCGSAGQLPWPTGAVGPRRQGHPGPSVGIGEGMSGRPWSPRLPLQSQIFHRSPRLFPLSSHFTSSGPGAALGGAPAAAPVEVTRGIPLGYADWHHARGN